MKLRKNSVWQNNIGKQSVRPFRFLEAESLEDIQAAIREAEAEGCRIRPIGSGHAPSDIAITDGYLLSLKHLNRLLPLDKDQLHQHSRQQHLVQVEGGITMHQLNQDLDKKGLALLNLGAIDAQTITGAIATSTHGTGRNLPSCAGMVRSILLVAAEGQKYRIEPADGITDPQKHAEQGVRLIQEDEVFNSVLVSMGCMGIIYSYILEVRPQYWLYENVTLEKWSRVRQMLMDESIFDDFEIELNGKKQLKPVRGIMIVVNPYQLKGDHTCALTRLTEVDEPLHLPRKDRRRDPVSRIAGNSPLVYRTAVLLVNHFPKLFPYLVERSVRNLADNRFVNKSHKVLLNSSEYLMSKSYSCEYAYNRHRKDHIRAVEALFRQAKRLSENYGIYPSSTFAIRFTKASAAYLSPEYNQDVAYVVTPTLFAQRGANLILNTYQDTHIAHNGKPHWGKVTNRVDGRLDLIRRWYPKFDSWQRVMRRFNPNDTFSNSFTVRLGLTQNQSSIPVAMNKKAPSMILQKAPKV